MVELLDRSPLGDSSLAVLTGAGVTLAERPRDGLLMLAGPDTMAFRGEASQVLGILLPAEPCGAEMADNKAALWLSPGRWLVRVKLDDVARLAADLSRKISGDWGLVVDVSHQYLVFSLTGWGAPAFLAKGCSLDLHPDKFSVGQCARTLLGDLPLLIHKTEDTPSYDLIVDQSLARFAWWWFAEQVS